MKCPLKFSRYEFEGGEVCIGAECGFFGGVCGSVDAHSKTEPNLTEQSESLSDAISENLGKTQDSEIDEPDTIRNELEDNGYVVMPYHNGEKQAKLMGKEYEFAITDELHDSREKLGADVDNLVKNGFVTYAEIMELLDRQAAITERECLVQSVQGADAILTAENAELQAKVDELYKSCDILRDKKLAAEREKSELAEQLEAAHAKNRALKAHISKMQQGRHGWHVKGVELQRQVDELTAQLHASNAERARLRECLGIATDNAHDFLTLVDESGNVYDRDEGLA